MRHWRSTLPHAGRVVSPLRLQLCARHDNLVRSVYHQLISCHTRYWAANCQRHEGAERSRSHGNVQWPSLAQFFLGETKQEQYEVGFGTCAYLLRSLWWQRSQFSSSSNLTERNCKNLYRNYTTLSNVYIHDAVSVVLRESIWRVLWHTFCRRAQFGYLRRLDIL